jgi:hypothetical protein
MKNKHVGWSGWRWWLRVGLPVLAIAFSFMLTSTAWAAVTSNTRFPIHITAFVPCAAGGAGETVVLSGDLHALFTTTLDGNGGFHAKFHFNPQGVSGIGQTTGDKYQGTGVTQGEFNGKVGFETSFVNNFRIIGQGPGNNFLVHENMHITVHPNGRVTGFVDNIRVSCK